MLIYSQSTGELRAGECLLAIGCSGRDAARNNPDFEHVAMEGPIPRNCYRVHRPRFFKGTWIMRLIPDGDPERKQRYFLSAGDVSRGCIHVPAETLQGIVDLVKRGETFLTVIA